MSARPDLLWIVTTQWRADALGYAGSPEVQTPALDRLAQAAVNYAEAVTPHPFGPFARAALLTGVPSPENGVRDYFDPLPASARTVAHELAERGYRTAFFGKWHLAPRDPQAPLVGEAHARTLVPPERRGGFGFWEGFEGGFLLNDPWLHGTRLPEPKQFSGYQSDVLCQRAADWLATSIDGPRFVVVSLEAPHPPYGAPAAGIAPRLATPSALVPPEARERAARELAGYRTHLAATDRAIGRLLAAWPGAGGVIFTSVHGDMHGDHGLFRKGWPHEGSIRVPLLARPPLIDGATPEIRSGGRRTEPISLLDLPAMTLAWADRRDWRLARDHAAISMPSVVALPDQCDRPWRGVRTVTRKLVLNPDGSDWLYFERDRDPDERVNRATDPATAEERQTLRALIDRGR